MRFFRRPSPAPTPAAAAPRSHLEDQRRLALRGWALAADGGEGLLTLWLDGRPAPATIRRVERHDVRAQAAIAVSPQARPGFEVELDAAAWHAAARAGQPLAVELRLDDQPIAQLQWRLDDDELAAWARELLDAAPEQPGQVAAWQRLAGFLRADGRTRPAWAWVDEAWAAQGGAPGERTEGRVEHVDGALVSGWASDPHGRPEHFSIDCAGRSWPVAAARFERQDVAHAVPGAARQAGFVLALPADLWAALPEEGAPLQLRVNGRPLLVPPRTATRADLATWLADAERAAAEAAGGPAEAAREARQTLALARAHAAAAARPRAAPPAPPALAAPVAAALPAEPPPPDAAAASLWAWQRAFNDALAAPGATAASAWTQLHAGAPPPDDAWHRFALSLVPAFCAEDALPTLRPHLGAARLADLAHADGAWELSLLLPVAVLDGLCVPGPDARIGGLAAANALLPRIARALPAGWLNTESLLDAVRRVRRAVPAQPLDDAELRAFIHGALQVLDAVGSDVWSRSHDRHLVQAQAELLVLAEGVDDAIAAQAQRAVLRRCVLLPGFWDSWRALAVPPAALQPIAEAATAWPRRLAALQRAAPDDDAWAAAWACLRALAPSGLADAPLLRRHLLALAPPADASALGILPGELDGADRLRRWPTGEGAAAQWAALLPVPPAPLLAARVRLQQAERRWAAALAAGDVPALAGLQPGLTADALALARLGSGFIGLLHLARAWWSLAGRPAADTLRAGLAGVLAAGAAEALAAVERRRHEMPVPPPALLAVADLLRHAAAGLPGALAGAATALTRQLAAAWPAWAPAMAPWQVAAEAPGCAAAVPGASPLVVVRQRDGSGAALQRIALGWGAELARRGVAWCVWRLPGAAAASTVHWQGFEAGDLLAALGWLLDHSRCGHLCFVDDDVELGVDAWLAGAGPAHHLHGVVMSPAGGDDGDGLRWVAPGLGLGLSRAAARSAVRLAETRRGAAARCRLGSDDARLLAELLAWVGVAASDEGHMAHLRRPPSAEPGGAVPGWFHNAWPPMGHGPVVLAAGPLAAGDDGPLGPPRVWPPDQPPRLPGGPVPAQQLVRLSPPGRVDGDDGDPCVIAVARNEGVLLPHFLAHYRGLGVRRFAIADNLSTDGSREFLLSQPDVCVYSVDTAYRDSHYGVAWQMALLTAHAQRGWALVADIDEFLAWPGCEAEGLPALCARLDAAGHDAALALMIDMYPPGPLDEADFAHTPPFEAAPCFDARPVLPWRLGSGAYSQGGTWVSAVRHRLIPGSPPNHYTAQKLPLMRYRAGVRLSEGLHYAAGLRPAPQPVFLAHFKYHKGFRAKVEEEIARRQHFNGAEEYRRYRALWAEARGHMADARLSRRYTDSSSFADIAWT